MGVARADAPAVQAVQLAPATWRASIQLAAAIDAGQNATLGAERAGRVVAVLYSSGQQVAAGTVLVQLDDGPQAAQLALDQARLTEARDALAREMKLVTIAGASRAAVEQAQADAAEAVAQVSYDQAMLAQSQIVAPFAGLLGIRKISAGDYINQGQVVAQITQLSPLRVLFSVPQTEAGGIAPGEAFSLAAPSVDGGSSIKAVGKITALSPQVDDATNARDAEGVVTGNAAGLLPGMVGLITLATGAPQPAFALPNAALNDGTLGPYVFVLDPAGAHYTLRTVYVSELGNVGPDTYVAAAGLAAGQRVLALGGFKLTDGASVTLAGASQAVQ